MKRVKVGESCVGGVCLFKNFFPFSSPFKINKLKQKFINPSLNFVCVFNAHFLIGYILSDIVFCAIVGKIFHMHSSEFLNH